MRMQITHRHARGSSLRNCAPTCSRRLGVIQHLFAVDGPANSSTGSTSLLVTERFIRLASSVRSAQPWPEQNITAKQIDNAVANALNFKPALKAFYILTTAPDDARLLNYVRKLNERYERE